MPASKTKPVSLRKETGYFLPKNFIFCANARIFPTEGEFAKSALSTLRLICAACSSARFTAAVVIFLIRSKCLSISLGEIFKILLMFIFLSSADASSALPSAASSPTSSHSSIAGSSDIAAGCSGVFAENSEKGLTSRQMYAIL